MAILGNDVKGILWRTIGHRFIFCGIEERGKVGAHIHPTTIVSTTMVVPISIMIVYIEA